MTHTQSYSWLLASLFTFCILGLVQGQSNTSIQYSNLTDAFPPLLDLYTTSLDKSPWIGGQNFTRCCLLAVSQSYIIQDGNVSQNPNTDFIGLPPTAFNASQFPCGAVYNGNSSGAPLVTVPYSWCNQNCAGWQQSSNKALGQWVQPFVGFILPAAVFCLNVRTPCLHVVIYPNWKNFH
jgi:hypothetical protein